MEPSYKSWSDLKKRLDELICDSLHGRVSYFLTYYHKVRNCYGRAAIQIDGKDAVCFSWINRFYQMRDISAMHENNPSLSWREINELHQKDWNKNATYYERDFITAVQTFRQMKISEAVNSENYVIKALAILDRRVGKRTLQRIADEKLFIDYPDWLKQFYCLRLESEGLKD